MQDSLPVQWDRAGQKVPRVQFGLMAFWKRKMFGAGRIADTDWTEFPRVGTFYLLFNVHIYYIRGDGVFDIHLFWRHAHFGDSRYGQHLSS